MSTEMYYITDLGQYRFCPVPLIEQRKTVTRTNDDEDGALYAETQLTFTGKLLPNKPALSSDKISDDPTCMELIDRKTDQLLLALSEDRGNLLIFDSNGYTVLNVTPKVTDIQFPESQMRFDRDYAVTFVYETDFGTKKVKNYTEDWGFESRPDDTITVNHSLSADGLPDLPAGTGALQNAKNFVLARADEVDFDVPSFNTSPYTSGNFDVNNLDAYNHERSETINEAAASYSIDENWILASGSYKDDRSRSVEYRVNETGGLVPTTRVEGMIQGYGDDTFTKFENAKDAWNNTIKSEIGFEDQFDLESKSSSFNRFGGQVRYSLVRRHDDTEDDILQNRSIQRQFRREQDGSVTQSITTRASVRKTSESGIQHAITFVINNNDPIDSTNPDFDTSVASGNLQSISTSRDEYNKSFSQTRVFRDGGPPDYFETYTVQRQQNIRSAPVTVSINGRIQGLSKEDHSNSTVRFQKASGAYFNDIEPLARDRVLPLVPDGTCLNDDADSETLAYQVKNGQITYSKTFSTKKRTSNSNIADEEIQISFNNQADVVSTIPIPGKSTGPVLQDIATQPARQKSLSIRYTMKENDDSCGTPSVSTQSNLLSIAKSESDSVLNDEEPSATFVKKTQDQVSFNRQTLVYTRQIQWIFTPF